MGDPARATGDFNAIFIGGSTIVYSGPVWPPQWRSPAASTPAPFDFGIAFSQPFALPAGPGFVWEISAASDVLGHADMVPQHNLAVAEPLGTGCLSTPQTRRTAGSAVTAIDPTQQLDMLVYGSVLTPLAPAALLLGASDPNLTVPGLCSAVRSDDLIIAPTTTDAGGNASVRLQTAFRPAFLGGSIYAQFATLDANQPGLPIGLSNGLRQTVPAPRPAPSGTAVLSHGGPTPQVLSDYAIVTQVR